MQNRSTISRTLLVTACALSCAGQAQAGFLSWTGNLVWNSEPAKIARYTATGAAAGMAVSGSYLAYYGGLQGKMSKVIWAGVIGGGLGMLCSQLYGVKASVKKIEAIVTELRNNVTQLTVTVNNGFNTVQEQLAKISSKLKNCATFEALAQVKVELMAWMSANAQSQKEDTRRQLAELEHRLQQVITSDRESLGRIEQMLRTLLTKNSSSQPVIVNVHNANSALNTNSNESTNNNSNSNHMQNRQTNTMRQDAHNQNINVNDMSRSQKKYY